MLKTAFILFLLLASGCKDQYTPKPYGYFRIDFPEKQWVASPDTLPYCFEQSAQATLEARSGIKQAEPGWMNLCYPQYNAKLHLSYKEIRFNDTALQHFLGRLPPSGLYAYDKGGIHQRKILSKRAGHFRTQSTSYRRQYRFFHPIFHHRFHPSIFCGEPLYFNLHPAKDSLGSGHRLSTGRHRQL